MKRLLCVILMLFVALTVCFAGCGATKGNNKQTSADDGGDGTKTVETGDNELPLVPFE